MKSKVEEYLSDNIPSLDTMNYISFLGLSLTTLYTANSSALAKLEPILGGYRYLAPAVALGFGLFFMYIFDVDLRKNFVTACQTFTAKNWKSAKTGLKAMALFFLFIAGVRLSLSTCATFISGAVMADNLVEDGDTEGLEKMLAEKQRTKQTITLETANQVKEAREAANAEAAAVVKNAIEEGPGKWQKLYNQRNGWFLKGGPDQYGNANPAIKAYLKAISEAKAEAKSIKKESSNQIALLQSNSARLMQEEANDEQFATITKIKAAQIEKAANKEWLFQFALWIADFVLSLFAILTSIALAVVLPHRPDYVLFREETSATSILKEAVFSIWRIVKSYGVKLVAILDGKAETVANSLGNTVIITAKTVALQRGNVAQRPNNQPPNTTPKSAAKQVANGVAPDYYLVAEELQKARRQLASYESKKRNNVGRATTNHRGIDKWTKEVDRLEIKLQGLEQNN